MKNVPFALKLFAMFLFIVCAPFAVSVLGDYNPPDCDDSSASDPEDCMAAEDYFTCEEQTQCQNKGDYDPQQYSMTRYSTGGHNTYVKAYNNMDCLKKYNCEEKDGSIYCQKGDRATDLDGDPIWVKVSPVYGYTTCVVGD